MILELDQASALTRELVKTYNVGSRLRISDSVGQW